MRDAAELLAELGHEVEEIDPPWDEPQLLELFNVAFGTFIALVVGFGATIAGREPTPDDIEPLSLTMFRQADRALGPRAARRDHAAAGASRGRWSATCRRTTPC